MSASRGVPNLTENDNSIDPFIELIELLPEQLKKCRE